MQNRIVLVSDDSDFFEYINSKLKIRKQDELYRYGYEALSDKLPLISSAVVIIDSENQPEQCLESLKQLKGIPAIVFAYNINPDFELEAYKLGALSFVTPFISDREFDTRLTSALRIASLLDKNSRYRKFLVKNNILKNENEVFLDYENVLDKELEKIRAEASDAVLMAISPNEKTKFLLNPNQIEESILNNIRANDILMNYAPNKYFLILRDTSVENAEKIWQKIRNSIPEKVYAGFVKAAASKVRQQLVNEVLNKLHEAINCDMDFVKRNTVSAGIKGENFKIFRQEFNKKIEKIVIPVFYHIQQKYNNRLFNALIQIGGEDGFYTLNINGRHTSASFTITSPGFSKINIDITYSCHNTVPGKRFSLEPDELEAGFLEDLLEQFIMEFRKEINDYNT